MVSNRAYRMLARSLAVLAFAGALWTAPLVAQDDGDQNGDTAVEVLDATHVVIDNDNFLDMRIYAVSGGRRHQLGTVTGFTQETFVLPSWVLVANAPLRLVALPVGTGRTYSSPEVTVDPGDLVEWQLRNNLLLSSISVWKS